MANVTQNPTVKTIDFGQHKSVQGSFDTAEAAMKAGDIKKGLVAAFEIGKWITAEGKEEAEKRVSLATQHFRSIAAAQGITDPAQLANIETAQNKIVETLQNSLKKPMQAEASIGDRFTAQMQDQFELTGINETRQANKVLVDALNKFGPQAKGTARASVGRQRTILMKAIKETASIDGQNKVRINTRALGRILNKADEKGARPLDLISEKTILDTIKSIEKSNRELVTTALVDDNLIALTTTDDPENKKAPVQLTKIYDKKHADDPSFGALSKDEQKATRASVDKVLGDFHNAIDKVNKEIETYAKDLDLEDKDDAAELDKFKTAKEKEVGEKLQEGINNLSKAGQEYLKEMIEKKANGPASTEFMDNIMEKLPEILKTVTALALPGLGLGTMVGAPFMFALIGAVVVLLKKLDTGDLQMPDLNTSNSSPAASDKNLAEARKSQRKSAAKMTPPAPATANA